MPGSSILPADALGRLFAALTERGFTCVGPTVRDGAIVYDHVAGPVDLPQGWTDVQEPGQYRLERRSDDAYFGYVVGPHSWKKYLFPPELRLWRMRRSDGGFDLVEDDGDLPRYAFFGVRACELAALGIQDRVFTSGAYPDAFYAAVRDKALVIAVSCTQSAATCFCSSMGTGPAVDGDCDLALTEVVGDEHLFLVRAHSPAGVEILESLDLRPSTREEEQAARASVERAARQERSLPASDLSQLMCAARESSRWEEIATRCLACANCTLVCPTCFCSDVEDVSDLTGEHADRWRRWDSCFNPGFSSMHGGEVRRTISSRYRQWLSHKLGTWVDQFGSSGCVGCGRCISWCPVGIDLTEEVVALGDGSAR